MTTVSASPTTAPTRVPDRTEAPADTGPWVGRPLDRADGTAKATGSATFSAEYQVPDLAHAVLVHASIARGRIRRIDTARAEAHPGVVAVLTHLNAPKLVPASNRTNLMDLSTMVIGSRVPYLNTDEVYYDGQPVAVVVAERVEAAQYAASLVEVDYVELPAHVDFAAEQGRAKEVSQSLGMPTMSGRKGDAQAALASCSAPRGPAVHHADPEPQRDGAARHDRGLGRRLPHRLGRRAEHRLVPQAPRAAVRRAGGEGPGAGALRRRRLRRQGLRVVGNAADGHGRPLHRASRADGAHPRRGSPDRGRPVAHRPAGRSRRHRGRSSDRPPPRGGHADLADGRQRGPGGRRVR